MKIWMIRYWDIREFENQLITYYIFPNLNYVEQFLTILAIFVDVTHILKVPEIHDIGY